MVAQHLWCFKNANESRGGRCKKTTSYISHRITHTRHPCAYVHMYFNQIIQVSKSIKLKSSRILQTCRREDKALNCAGFNDACTFVSCIDDILRQITRHAAVIPELEILYQAGGDLLKNFDSASAHTDPLKKSCLSIQTPGIGVSLSKIRSQVTCNSQWCCPLAVVPEENTDKVSAGPQVAND